MFSRFTLLILVGLSAITTDCNSNPLRYQPSGLYTKFTYSEEHSYAYYRRDVREKLTRNWQELLEAKGAKTATEVERIADMLTPTDKPPLNCLAGPDRAEDGK